MRNLLSDRMSYSTYASCCSFARLCHIGFQPGKKKIIGVHVLQSRSGGCANFDSIDCR